MIHLVLVAVGAAAGSMVFIVAWQRQWNWRQILVTNVVVCALAGAVAGALVFVAHETVLSSFLSYGLFATAAPFASSLLPLSPPRNVSDAWQLIRRTSAILAVNTLFCATAASATYMLVAGSFFYVTGPVSS
jgi:hypothetical protein